jgi:transcriptional regulator of arginine metabolism
MDLYTDSAKRIDMKTRRLSAIRQLVEQEPVHSQEALRQRLSRMGFDVTQATLSRDIKELGLMKRSSDGAYQAAGPDASSPVAAAVALSRALGEFQLSVDVAQHLVVVKTGPGQAQLLGLAIDRARLPEVVGTIAGDDTILVICRDGRQAQATRHTLEQLAAEA